MSSLFLRGNVREGIQRSPFRLFIDMRVIRGDSFGFMPDYVLDDCRANTRVLHQACSGVPQRMKGKLT